MSAPATVGYQGERGAFSEGAAWALAPGLRAEPRRSFPEVVRAVETRQDQAGVLPVENTLAGGVTAAWDALVQGDVRAVSEAVLPIRHALLGVAGADPSEVVEVRSHPVALAQCRRFFDEHPGIEPVAAHDTAGAARVVAELGDPSIAALAGRHSGDAYGLTVLADDLQDRDDNQTRFLLVVRSGQNEPVACRGAAPLEGTRWKTGLSVKTPNRPGELRDLLTVFADRGLDLTFIVSRPTGTPWTYRFILEFHHGTLEERETCVEAASASGREVRVLGTYGAVQATAP